MSFRFHCSNCQQRLSVSTRKRGQDVKCPRCHRVVRVPESEAPESAEAAIEVREGPLETFPDVVPQDDLVYAEPAPASPSEAGATNQSVQIPRYVLYTQGFLLGAVAFVFFIFGLSVGSRSNRDLAATDNGPAIVSGTVVYEDQQGTGVPDTGSVVVLLPVFKRPDQKAAASGLRPDDPEPEEDHPALLMLRSLGGDYARTDRRGRFQVRAAATGRYYLLVISKRGLRTDDDSLPPDVLARLGRYFLPATELLGQHRYQWKELVLRKDQQVNVDF